jgi:hypothetical protein
VIWSVEMARWVQICLPVNARLENGIVVRSRHAHACALAWLDGAVDSTTASWLPIEQGQRAMMAPSIFVFDTTPLVR